MQRDLGDFSKKKLLWEAHERAALRQAAPSAPVLPGGKMAPGTAIDLTKAGHALDSLWAKYAAWQRTGNNVKSWVPDAPQAAAPQAAAPVATPPEGATAGARPHSRDQMFQNVGGVSAQAPGSVPRPAAQPPPVPMQAHVRDWQPPTIQAGTHVPNAPAAPRIDPRVSAHDAAEAQGTHSANNAHQMQAASAQHAAAEAHGARQMGNSAMAAHQGAGYQSMGHGVQGAVSGIGHADQARRSAEMNAALRAPSAAAAHSAAERAGQAAHAVKPGFLSRNKGRLGLAAGGAALLGLGAYGASRAAGEQDVRIRDYMQNAQQNAGTPLPPMAVHASYDDFAERAKLGELQPMYPTVQGALANSMATQLATKFIGEPIDAAHKALKKKFYDEPKQQQAFDEAVQGDDMLREAHTSNPAHLTDAFSTLKKFAPSMASHPQATRSFLRQAHMAGTHGSGMDFATIRMLAETEKFVQNSKGVGR